MYDVKLAARVGTESRGKEELLLNLFQSKRNEIQTFWLIKIEF